jgi:hypothetical protein
MYSAADKRFMAVDPFKGTVTDPKTLVQYPYVMDNPLVYIDPSGLITMGLRDLVNETYGTDKNLKWDASTRTATVGPATFAPGFVWQNGEVVSIYINSSGSMMVESSYFAKMVGLSGKYGSCNMFLTEEQTRKAVRSEYADMMVHTPGSGFILNPKKYYFLDYNGNTIDVRITKVSMHVSNINGDAKNTILNQGAYGLADWLQQIYFNTYGNCFSVGKTAIAEELLGHAAPDQLMTSYDNLGNPFIDTMEIFWNPKYHTQEADIAIAGVERPFERWLWDNLADQVLTWPLIGKPFNE